MLRISDETPPPDLCAFHTYWFCPIKKSCSCDCSVAPTVQCLKNLPELVSIDDLEVEMSVEVRYFHWHFLTMFEETINVEKRIVAK